MLPFAVTPSSLAVALIVHLAHDIYLPSPGNPSAPLRVSVKNTSRGMEQSLSIFRQTWGLQSITALHADSCCVEADPRSASSSSSPPSPLQAEDQPLLATNDFASDSTMLWRLRNPKETSPLTRHLPPD